MPDATRATYARDAAAGLVGPAYHRESIAELLKHAVPTLESELFDRASTVHDSASRARAARDARAAVAQLDERLPLRRMPVCEVDLALPPMRGAAAGKEGTTMTFDFVANAAPLDVSARCSDEVLRAVGPDASDAVTRPLRESCVAIHAACVRDHAGPLTPLVRDVDAQTMLQAWTTARRSAWSTDGRIANAQLLRLRD